MKNKLKQMGNYLICDEGSDKNCGSAKMCVRAKKTMLIIFKNNIYLFNILKILFKIKGGMAFQRGLPHQLSEHHIRLGFDQFCLEETFKKLENGRIEIVMVSYKNFG